MDIVLFSLGLILVIIGLPFCFSCQIQSLLNKISTSRANQTSQQSHQNVNRNRTVGLFSIIVGVLLIVISFIGVSTVEYISGLWSHSTYSLLTILTL